MNRANAYFHLLITDKGTSLKINPVDIGNDNLSVEEVARYLERFSIHNYDMKELNIAIRKVSEPTEMFILSEKIEPVNEIMDIFITENKLNAVARFYAPSNIGKRLTKEEIYAQLKQNKIINGIDEQAILKQLNSPVYCYDIVIASGVKPVEGKNAFITYHFILDLKAKPKLNEDGSVDFHQLNNINHIKKGDVLATLTPEDPGVSGMDIFGNELKPKKVVKKILRYGKNISLSEDKCTLISEMDGHAMLVDEKVFVYNTYEVPADIDNSTGDIKYEGNLYIKGNVRSGFKVEASGNIEIDGVVEAAQVYAGGDIVLKRGIQGMGKGVLICRGNLIARFIESSIAKVDGYVHTETIMHSKITAQGDVIVQGKKASLIGGHVRSTTLIEAKVIGSTMGTTTIVEVGMDPKLKDELEDKSKTVMDKNTELNKLKQICEILAKKNQLGQLDKDKKQLFIKMLNNIKQLKEEIAALHEEIDDIYHKLAIFEDARIKVHGEIYAGVRVAISDDFIYVHNTEHHCQFRKKDGEIVSVPL